ncbi:MAG: DsbA family protein [Polyangiales bacterium]
MNRSLAPRRAFALALLSAALGACSQPAPVVDEERLARRVVALLRREGLVVAMRDGGAAPPSNEDPDNASEDPDERAEENSDERADEAVDAPQPAPSRTPSPAAFARAAPPGSGRSVLRAPIAAIPAATPAVTTGTGDDALVWTTLDGAATLGPADALVTVVTFVDAQCPFSARLLPSLRELQRAHPAEVRLALRHRPLAFHGAAWGAAVFAEFARASGGSDAVFGAFEQLFSHQRELDRPHLDVMARALGLDPLHLADALDAPAPSELDRAVARDEGLAESANVQATPTSFFNGRRVAGAVPLANLERAFEEARERARRALSRGVRRAALYDTVCRTTDNATPPRRTPTRAP